MTIYYLLHSEKIIEVQNLLEPVLIDGKKNVYMNNISNSEGYEYQDQYKMNRKYLDIRKILNL